MPPRYRSAAGDGLRLSGTLDPLPMRELFRRHGRFHAPNVLAEQSARRLLRCLQEEVDWRLNCNLGDGNLNLSQEQLDAMSEVDRTRLDRSFLAGAQGGFQYAYGNWPAYDLWRRAEAQPARIIQLMQFLNGPEFLEFARAATGLTKIREVDAQATRYGPGHFLTSHTDADSERPRLAAYVLNLTPAWRPDWGGILQFLGPDGHVEEGYAPVFNALNVFRIPKAHAVSYVAPFAGGYRYSVSGWLLA